MPGPRPLQPLYPDLDALLAGAKDSLRRADELQKSRDADAAAMPVSPSPSSGGDLKSFLGGVKETLLPTDRISDVWEGPKYAAQHPIDSAKLLFGAAQDAAQSEFEKAQDAPSLSEKVGHYAAGALPFVGPAAAHAGESFAQGDFAHGAGQTAGLLLPFGLGELLHAPQAERPVARVPDFAGGERNPASVRPEPFGPEPAPAPEPSWLESVFGGKGGPAYGGKPTRIKGGADPQAFEAPEQGAGRVNFREEPVPAPVQEPAPFINSEQPAIAEQPAPTSTRPKLSADDVAGMLRGREKFSTQNPEAELPPGARDELDRAGVEYNRTQSELKRLLQIPDADPAEVARMKQGARELGSRLRKGAKTSATPSVAPDAPTSTFGSLADLLKPEGSMGEVPPDAGAPPKVGAPGRDGHFILPEPAFILPEEQQLKFLERTPARVERAVERRMQDTGRVEGDRRVARSADPATLARIEQEMNAVDAASNGSSGEPIAPAATPDAFQAEYGPDPGTVEMNAGLAPPAEIRDLFSTPEGRTKLGGMAQAHQAGSLLFNPLTLARILVSNGSSAVMKSLEHSINERSLAPTGRTIRELLNVPEMTRDAVEAFNNPHTKYSRDGAVQPSGGIFGLGTRAIGAVDAPFRGAMERAGFPEEDALTVTQQRRPVTETGRSAVDWQQRTAINRFLMPFIKSKVNEFETGMVEPVQSAARLLTGEGSGSDVIKTGAAAGAGALGYAASDKLDKLPLPLRGLVLALGGLYNTPLAMGYAAGKAKDGAQGAYEALVNALPLASGFSMNPKTQMNRFIPRILNPDYWTGKKRETHGLAEAIQSQIPGAAQQLPEKSSGGHHRKRKS